MTACGRYDKRSDASESQPAATPRDNTNAVPDVTGPSSIWQNEVGSAPAPAGRGALPAVPRNGVASLPPLPKSPGTSSYLHGRSLAGHSEALTGYKGGRPTGCQGSGALLSPLPGSDILEFTYATDIIQQDGLRPMCFIGEVADDRLASTDGEDELGRAVLSAMSEHHGRQGKLRSSPTELQVVRLAGIKRGAAE